MCEYLKVTPYQGYYFLVIFLYTHFRMVTMLGTKRYSKTQLLDMFYSELPIYNRMVDGFVHRLGGYHHVLDVGGGSRLLPLRLAAEGHDVISLDNTTDSVFGSGGVNEALRQKCRVVYGGVEDLIFGDYQFDAVTSSLIFPTQPDTDLYLRSIYDSITFGGRFVLSYRLPHRSVLEATSEAQVVYKKLRNQGIFPDHEAEWAEIRKDFRYHTAAAQTKSLLLRRVRGFLEHIGFKNIQTELVFLHRDYVMITADKN